MPDSSAKRIVSCGTHGEVRSAFVCCHLRQDADAPLGFFEPEIEPNDPDEDLQAWCNACDAMLDREGEWNDVAVAHANIKLVCEFCFAKLREIHDRPVASLYKR